MSRRSSRLASGGYYNTDEESDSGSVTNIFYGENPVKVFKKKAGTRKARPQTPTRAQTSASSTAPETRTASDRGDGVGSFLLSSQTPTTSRTVPSVCTSVTPRPALTLSSSRCRTPPCCPSASPEKSFQAGRCSSSRPGFTLRTDQKELSLNGVDSSGYSSSEGPHRKAETAAVASSASSTGSASSASSTSSASSSSRTSRTSSTRSTSRINGTSGPPSNGYRSRISSPFIRLMDSVSSMAVVVQSKAAALAQTPVSSGMKKACSVLLFLLTLSLCLWFLPPLLASLSSRLSVIRTPSQSPPKSRPLTPAAPPPLSSLHASLAADPTSVSAAVEERMQRVLEELLLRQEELLSQVKQNLKVDLQGMEAKLEDMDLDHRRRLDQDLSGLERRLEGQRTESLSAAAGLSVRVQVLEAQNAKLSQEWSSIQRTPPPGPCPDTSAGPTSIQLTPELQHAMEKWLTDRIKEQDAIRLSDGGRPLADKMADFALETQGASVISTRCSETYRTRSACVTLFGFPLWYPSESPRTVIQGHPVLLPGKCWAFHGVQGTLVISLSHAIRITHVTLDHLPHYNSPTGRIDSAPKDFEVYGMKKDPEEGTLLGTFTYEEQGGSTQTFKLPESSEEVYRWVELRVLSNWGQVEYTCLYRFRVHGRISSR